MATGYVTSAQFSISAAGQMSSVTMPSTWTTHLQQNTSPYNSKPVQSEWRWQLSFSGIGVCHYRFTESAQHCTTLYCQSHDGPRRTTSSASANNATWRRMGQQPICLSALYCAWRKLNRQTTFVCNIFHHIFWLVHNAQTPAIMKLCTL